MDSLVKVTIDTTLAEMEKSMKYGLLWFVVSLVTASTCAGILVVGGNTQHEMAFGLLIGSVAFLAALGTIRLYGWRKKVKSVRSALCDLRGQVKNIDGILFALKTAILDAKIAEGNRPESAPKWDKLLRSCDLLAQSIGLMIETQVKPGLQRAIIAEQEGMQPKKQGERS